MYWIAPGSDDGEAGDDQLFGPVWWVRLLEGQRVAQKSTRSLLGFREAAGEELLRQIDEGWDPSELKAHLTYGKPWGDPVAGNLAGSCSSSCQMNIGVKVHISTLLNGSTQRVHWPER